MKNRRRYFKIIGLCFSLSIVCTILFSHFYLKSMLPEKIYITAQEAEDLNLHIPLPGDLSCESSEVVLGTGSNIPSNEISITMNQPFTVYSASTGQYKLSFKLFGLWNYKNIELQVMEETQVIPGGMPIGIYLESDGILVVGTTSIETVRGEDVSPCDHMLQSGDYILEAQGKAVENKEQLIEIVASGKGQPVELLVRREEKLVEVSVTPVQSIGGDYKLGIWVRDDTQGIGTITYVGADGSFGALGHGISDADTGLVVECRGGTLYRAQIRGIMKGSVGKPGSLSGIICYGADSVMGEVSINTSQGIFGTANTAFMEQLNREPVEIAYRQEVKEGPAVIWCTVDGELKEYDVSIVEAHPFSGNKNKGMVIEITDPELLEKTGGIVQGMSGSPIIQNGKLVGAVTHVLVNDPTRGYGIFIENMLEAAESAEH